VFAESCLQVGIGDEECWREAKTADSKCGQEDRESENEIVDTDRIYLRQVGREQETESVDAPEGKCNAERCAQQAKHGGFAHELANQARAAGAKSRTKCEFLCTRSPARQQEISKVGACNQQNEADRAKQHKERRPDIFDEQRSQRLHTDDPSFVVSGI